MSDSQIVVRLGSVANIVMGQAPAGKDCNKFGEGTPFVKVGEFGDDRPVIREWTTDPKKMARESDVLICVVGATCGKINLGIDCAIGRSVAALRPDPAKLDQRYLWYFMQGKVIEMRLGSKGAAQTVISRDMLQEVELPIPPLAEQRRIVSILDEGFAGIATATANAEQNLANVAEVMWAEVGSILSDAASHSPNQPLGELVDVLDKFRKPITKKDRIAGPYPYYGATGVVDYVADFIFDEQLVLVGEDGAKWNACERSAYPISGKTWVNNHAHVLRPNREKVLDDWLVWSLNWRDLSAFITGLTVPKLNQAKLREIPIATPPLDRQREGIERLRKAEQLIDLYSKIAVTRAKSLNNLKAALLAEAFSGDLIQGQKAAAA